MSHRPYPNRERAARHVARQQAAASWHPDFVFDPASGRMAPWTPELSVAVLRRQSAVEAAMRKAFAPLAAMRRQLV